MCRLFAQAASGTAGVDSGYLNSRKPALISRHGVDYFGLYLIQRQLLPNFMVLGAGTCDSDGVNYEPQALLLPMTPCTTSILAGPIASGRLITNPINWEIVRHWLSSCDKRHSTTCLAAQKSMIIGLRFIDRKTLQIVQSPDIRPPYTTLSYL